MIEEHEVIVKVPNGYDLLIRVCEEALNRAARGKGRKRHAAYDNQPLEDQDIYAYSWGWRLDQIQKKVKEVPRLRKRNQLEELLDIIILASVEYAKVLDNIKKDTARR